MGRNNQRNRASRARARRERGPTPPRNGDRRSGPDPYAFVFGPSPEEDRRAEVERVLSSLLLVAAALSASRLRLLVSDELIALDAAQLDEMDRLASIRFTQVLVAAWERGWQPLDIVHYVRRSQSRAVPLLAAAIGAQALSVHAEQRAPASWRNQLVAVADEALFPALSCPLDRLIFAATAQGVWLVDAWTDLLLLLALLTRIPRLEQLVSPPSAWGRTPAPTQTADDGSDRSRLLSRIRTLLAKAEATDFPAEAEAFTAKAQDLMTRHAIDEALVRGAEDRPIDLTGVRVHIHNPYAAEKVHLLNQVARANRSRAVWNQSAGLVTVLGTPTDVDQVEMLFTSLLVQATRAMVQAGARRAGTGHRHGGTTPRERPAFQRSASFRRSFLMSYAVRIGERLNEANEAATASYGKALVPVMQKQARAVQAEFDRLFPRTREAGAGRYNAVGWEAGRQAADRAVFAAGRITV